MGALKTSTISKKGQTTIPLEIRESLNLKEGDTLVFQIGNDNKVTFKKSPLFRGGFGLFKINRKNFSARMDER